MRSFFISLIPVSFIFGCFGQSLQLGLPVGHTNRVNSANFSADYRQVITASSDNTVRIWDSFSGKQLKTLKGHMDVVCSAVYSSDFKHILTASGDNTARIWDSYTGDQLFILEGHTSTVVGATYSPNGKNILTISEDKTGRLWEAISGKLLSTLRGHEREIINGVFSPNGESILTNSWDGTARLWNASSGDQIHVFKTHSSFVLSAVFSPDGKFALTASSDSTAKLWDITSGKELKTLKGHEGEVHSAVFSPDGRRVLTTSSDQTACIWDAKTGEQLKVLEGHIDEVRQGIYSPNGKEILTVSTDRTVKCWDAETGQLIVKKWERDQSKEYNPEISYVNSIMYSLDGKLVLTSSENAIVQIWDANNGRITQTLKGNTSTIFGLSISSDSKQIQTSNSNDLDQFSEYPTYYTSITLDTKSGKIIQSNTAARLIDRIDFNPETNGTASKLHQKGISNEEIELNKIPNALRRNLENIDLALYSPEGSKILTFNLDKTICIWDTLSGKMLQEFKGHRGNIYYMSFSPNGKNIVVAFEDENLCMIFLWEVFSGDLLNTIVSKSFQSKPIFSNDGKSLLTLSGDQLIRNWDATNGKLNFILNGHSDVVNHVVYSSDDKKIYSVSNDGSIITWNAQTGEQLIRHFTFDNDPNKWIHLHPSGLFDASDQAMKLMYWIKGDEVIAFEQLKARYWLPGLWEKVIRGEQLPNLLNMQELKLQPIVQIGELENDTIPIKLIKRDGGYGAVSIWINGKEACKDARETNFDTSKVEQIINFSIKDHPFLKDSNTIEVKASSLDGTVQSRGDFSKLLLSQKTKPNPTFFGIIIGVEDYANDAINLKFPRKDAESIAKAVELGAKNLFGTEKQFVYTISSGQNTRPSKENIKKVFDLVAEKANSEDVLFLYLSGHGITWGKELESDFYFLTADAMTTDKVAFNDPVIRKNNSISTSEFVEWIKMIPALKQVMVIDACGSGKAVENLKTAREIESSPNKAIDRMRDRTGMYIVSGCAADAVSYEANVYGQGLLTYSILQGMKGAALKEYKFVDVFTILNHAREMVPKLANGIGGIQVPQLLIPTCGSFDIGILEDEDKATIPLSEPKQVFIKSILVDKLKYRDVLDISKSLNEGLNSMLSDGKKSNILYFDIDEYENSCQITGGYKQTKKGFLLDMSLRCGTIEKQFIIKAKTKDELVLNILEKTK